MFDLKYWEKLDKELPGWMSQKEAEFLVDNIQGNYYLEIGVAFGKSMSVVRHHYPELDIMGIDLTNHGVHKKLKEVNIVYGDANKINAGPFDTLFIDGDHTYKGCLSDFVHWYNKVKPGGKIIFHDYKRPTSEHAGVTKAVDAIKPLLEDSKETKYICCGTKPS